MEMDESLYNLLKGSNQIVHNRGRALAYLGNAEKKRPRDDIEAIAEEDMIDKDEGKTRHRYALKEKLKPIAPLNSTTATLPLKTANLSMNLFSQPHNLTG